MLSIGTETIMAQQAETYQEAIAKGNENLKSNKLFDAKAYFQMALGFRADDAYAKEKIQEIIKKLKSNENQDEKYYNVIDMADAYFENDAFDEALVAYGNALKIIPGDEYAQKKIDEIVRRKKEEKQKLVDYHAAMQKGETLLSRQRFQEAIDAFRQAQHFYQKKLEPTEKIKLANRMWESFKTKEKEVNKEIDSAAQYLLIRRYDQALIHYQKADSLLPGQTALVAKINQLRPKANQQMAFSRMAAEADRLYTSKNYLAAKMKYEAAAAIWPENNYPAEMLDKLGQRIALQRKDLGKNYQLAIHQADSLYGKREMDNAKAQYQMALNLKPNEAYPNNQIKNIEVYQKEEQKKLQANYATLLKHADSLLQAKSYFASRDEFEKAIQINPNAKYPRQQLKVIAGKLAEQAAIDKINNRYQSLIAEADDLAADSHFDLAIDKYHQAQLLKGGKSYLANKIKEIKKIIAEAKQKKALDEKYGGQLTLAKRLADEGRLDDAKKAFENALSLKPKESFPVARIHVIDSLINLKIQQVKINEAYALAIKQGDEYLSQKAYDDAEKAFEKARDLKPNESEPLKKMATIEATLSAIEQARQQQQAYDESLAKADKLLTDKNYEMARSQFENALTIKANETYPKQKINEIQDILIRLEKEKEQRYALAISKADNFFNNKEYQAALSQYHVASSIKVNETYPKQKIDACNQELAQLLRQQKAAYQLAIADADKLYAAKIFDKAIRAYQRAQQAKPDESYPAEMITKITQYIEENAVVDIVKDTVSIAANETRKFAFEPVRVDVRKSNYVLVKAANVDGKPFKIIFTYGKDNAKNGGFVVQVPEGKATHNFIIRIGNQYKWFSEDNNWFSIYPENQPLEVHLIRISKSK